MNDSYTGPRDQFLQRPLPSDEESERAIISGIILNNDLIFECLERNLVAADFYTGLHRRLYAAILELFQCGAKIDPILIGDALKRNGEDLGGIGGIATITTLGHGLPYFSDLKDYIDIVLIKSRARKLIQICQLSTSSAVDDEDFYQTLDQHEQLISELRNKDTSNHFVSMEVSVKESYEQITNFAKSGGHELLGITTGFKDIDVSTSGLEKTDLIILGARPSMGKTALALGMARRAAATENKPLVTIFSLEMARNQLTQRLIASEASVDLMRLRRGMLTNPEWTKVYEATAKLKELRIMIDDSPGLSTMQIRAKLRRLTTEYRQSPDLVMIDHLGLIKHAGDHRRSEHLRISDTTKDLKAMAKEFKIPILALHQLSRAVEKRSPPKPMMSDLRESGSIEEDADVIMFIYRPEYYLKDKCPELDRGVAEILIEKNRQGPTGPVKLAFLKQFARFEDHYGI